MLDYQIPIKKHSHTKILEQMNNSFYSFIENDRKSELLFFCYIRFEKRKFPVLVTTYDLIKDIFLHKLKNIDISLNNEIKTLEFGDIKFINEKSNLSIVEIKENLQNKINILELDDILYKDKSNIIYNNESIYIINSNNNDIIVSYGKILNTIGNNIF